MASCYKIAEENVLLIGEGNFSFSTNLVQNLKKEGSTNFSNIYATCVQPEIEGYIVKDNIEFLKSSGVNILFGVDATSLTEHPALENESFDKIIFNFPHIGGKMKIHLNRKLLCDFFLSATKVLKADGCVVVALCAGQGGTGAEIVPRKWVDTWKIVEMAAHADLKLVEVYLFPRDDFPEYISVGFRGGGKSFHTNNSMVHIFKITPPLSIEVKEDINDFKTLKFELQKDVLTYPYFKLPNENVFLNINKPQGYLYNLLCKFLKTCDEGIVIYEDDLPLTVDKSLYKNVPCLYKNCDSFLRSSLLEVIPSNEHHNCTLYYGFSFNQVHPDFTLPLMKCEICISGNNSIKYSNDFVKYMLSKHKGNLSEPEVLEKVAFLKDKCVLKEITTCYSEIALIDVDMLLVFLFDLDDWRQVRTPGVEVIQEGDDCRLHLPSLYPCSFTFDISFASPLNFVFEDFYAVLHYASDGIIVNFSLVNSYFPPDGLTENYCFRLEYKSYDKPLYHEKVVEYHHLVIGKSLERALNVTVL